MEQAPLALRAAPDFSGSYDREDVVFLLKPSAIEPVDIAAKEALIQSGARHYSEMLSAEKLPDARYMILYAEALARNAGRAGNQHAHGFAQGAEVVFELADAARARDAQPGQVLAQFG